MIDRIVDLFWRCWPFTRCSGFFSREVGIMVHFGSRFNRVNHFFVAPIDSYNEEGWPWPDLTRVYRVPIDEIDDLWPVVHSLQDAKSFDDAMLKVANAVAGQLHD